MEIPNHHVRLDHSILQAAEVSPEHAICVPMIGNSMTHKIQSGSTLAIDTSLTHIVDGEIYALERKAEARHADWTHIERRLMAMRARGMRKCAQELKDELNKVRRG